MAAGDPEAAGKGRGEAEASMSRLAPGVAGGAVDHRGTVRVDHSSTLQEAERREGDVVGRNLSQA